MSVFSSFVTFVKLASVFFYDLFFHFVFYFVVEKHTKLLSSTLAKAKKTSAPSCLTLQAARHLKTLYLDWDGRCK